MILITVLAALAQAHPGPVGDGCSPSVYRVLDDTRRNILSLLAEGEEPLCDDLLPPQGGWYRFLEAGQPALLARSCPGPGVCGTRSPAWLDPTSLTSLDTNTSLGEVCVSWSWPGSTDCCLYTLPVTVRLCPGFTSYFLQPTAACPVAYCSDTTTDNTPTGDTGLASLDYKSHYHYAEEGRAAQYEDLTYVVIKENLPTVKVSLLNGEVMFSCEIPEDLLGRHERLTWLKSGSQSSDEIIVKTQDISLDREIYTLPMTGNINLGEQVYCKIGSARSEAQKTGLEISPRTINLREDGETETVSLELVTPLKCSDCSLHVRLSVRNNCLRPADLTVWPQCELTILCQEGECQTAQLELAASQDMIDDEDTTNILEFEVWSEEDPDPWSRYKLDPVVVHVETLPSASCYVMTDPHIVTFDQRMYDLNTSGTFLLAQTGDGRHEVQVRTWRCGSVSCLCGLVAREDNDVVSVNMCSGEYGDSLPAVNLFNLGQDLVHTRVLEAREGKILRIEFPSGRSIQVFIEYWGMSLSLTVPGADQARTRGLCGTFDGDRDNDRPARSGEEWRLSAGQNMFDSRPVPGPGTRRREVCTQETEIVMMAGRDRGNASSLLSHVRHYTDITPVLLGREDTDTAGEGVYWTTHEEERKREREEEEKEVVRKVVTPDYPTPSGQTEKSILSLCADTVLNSSLSTLCAPYIQDKLYLPLDICVLDVRMMDDPSWAQFSLALVEMMCEEEVSRAQLGWDINYSGELVPASLLVRAFNCPNNCSSHGDCRAEKCDCYPGYSSYDCSHVDEFSFDLTPTPFPVMAGNNSLCDVSSHDCHTFTVFGQDFVSSSGLGCRVRPIAVDEEDPANWKYLDDRQEVGVEFIDDKTIRCSVSQARLDKMMSSWVESLTLEIEVTNTGTVWSTGIFLTVYNSTCEVCSPQSSPLTPKICRHRDDVCREGSSCLTDGAPHPSNSCQYCRNGDWHNRTDYRPIFTEKTATAKVLEGSKFQYDLPANGVRANLTLISGPLGSSLTGSSLTWTPAVGGNVTEEVFRVSSDSECERREEFVLKVSVLKCECENNGVCRMESGEVRCVCEEGYHGHHCQRSVCQPSPCSHGDCRVLDLSHFSCHCHTGYSGDLCDLRSETEEECSEDPSQCFTDHCLSSPCYPGVTCLSLGSTYQCGPCPPGYSPGDGVHCRPLTDPCASSPCHAGVQCVNVRMGDSTGYVCGLCPPGWHGDGRICVLEEHADDDGIEEDKEEVVEEEEEECPADSCYPGVRCWLVSGEARCGACPLGMSGDGVECLDIDDCSPSPCYPGVQCRDREAPGRGYHCGECPRGLVGDGLTCRPADTCTRHCSNGGVCVGNNQCRCESGWRGRSCRRPVCSKGCRNGGKCVAPETCSCKDGYSGINCREVTCRPKCMNGGKCRKNGRCRCPKGFTGPRCEMEKKSVRSTKKSKRKGRKRRNRHRNRVNADLVKQFLSFQTPGGL